MKKLMLLTAIALSVGCASNSRVQSIEEAEKTLGAHVEKANFNEHFCRGAGFHFYTEARTFYSFRCKDGSYFSLAK